MHTNKGFTLIELMIVIAIIGILASIALPAYMDYIGRSQAVEGFKLTSGLQNEVDIWHNQTGSFPQPDDVLITGYIGGLAGSLKGKYVKDNAITVMPYNGVIVVPFDKGSNKNETFEMQPKVNTSSKVIKWVCGGSIEFSRLPTSCKD